MHVNAPFSSIHVPWFLHLHGAICDSHVGPVRPDGQMHVNWELTVIHILFPQHGYDEQGLFVLSNSSHFPPVTPLMFIIKDKKLLKLN